MHVLSVAAVGPFMKKCTSQSVATSRTPFLSHVNLYADKSLKLRSGRANRIFSTSFVLVGLGPFRDALGNLAINNGTLRLPEGGSCSPALLVGGH